MSLKKLWSGLLSDTVALSPVKAESFRVTLLSCYYFCVSLSGKQWAPLKKWLNQFTIHCGPSFLERVFQLCWAYILSLNGSNIRGTIVAAAASEPEANERGSFLISRRLHYRGLQSLFLTKRKELWLCANGRFRMRSGMRKELWLCANGNILGCAVI